jgi:hypothetical protein
MQAEMTRRGLRPASAAATKAHKWPPEHVVDPNGQPSPFHPGQHEAWKSERRVTAMLAGTQGGKTGFGPWWLVREIERNGSGDYLAITATYDLFKLRMLPALLLVFDEILGIGKLWSGDRVIEIADPSTGMFQAHRSTDDMWARIILRSADASGGLEAATARAAWLDEAGQDRFQIDSWNAIKRRLAIHRGNVLITTTLYNLGWIKQQIHDTARDGGVVSVQEFDSGAEMETVVREADGWDDIKLVQFDSIVNPYYPMKEFEDARAKMPPDEFEMFWRGRVTTLRTLIYDCFDVNKHKVESFPIPQAWPRWTGTDPVGERIATVWVALDPDRLQLHVYREYYEPFGITTQGHVKNILNLSRREPIVESVGGSPSERQPRLDWWQAGLHLEPPPFGDVWVGIGRVYQLVKGNQLYVHDCCQNLLSEIGSYQRMKDSSGDLTDKIKDKSKYHLLDALRYVVAHLTEPKEETQVVYAPQHIGVNW